MANIAGWLFIQIFFIISLFAGYMILANFSLNKKYLVFFMMLSALFHFAGAIIYWHLTFSNSADAKMYFHYAAHYPTMTSFFGVDFIIYLVYWLRYLIFGSSYLGCYAFFAMIGFLGSVIYLVIFCELLKLFSERYNLDFLKNKMKFYSFLLICWPSSMFWTSNLGKDSLCFFLIALFFLSLLKIKKNFIYLIILIMSSSLLFLIRPYLFLIGFFAFLFWLILFSRKQLHLLSKFFLLVILVGLFIILADKIAHIGGFASYSLTDISNRASTQQVNLSVGTAISPVHNSKLIFLLLPFTALANLFMPLFYSVRNFLGIVASVENMYLLILVLYLVKNRFYWKKLIRLNGLLSYMFVFFIMGMAFLGMANTNLGLASREKLMYLPCLLIIMFLVFTLQKRSLDGKERIF